MPRISVIVPVYNTERYVSACLESLLAQREQDIEIIAVNNGCTDGSSDILRSYAARDARVKVIGIEHGEVAEARNAAIVRAGGEFLAFCDSDDTVPPNAYADMLRRAEQTRCDVVVGGHCNMRDDGGHSENVLPCYRQRNDFLLLFTTPCVWNKLIRREFLEMHQLRFPPLIMGEDVLFLAMLLKCSPKIESIRKPVYQYWHHVVSDMPSMTHRYSLEFFKLHLLCRQRLLAEMDGTPYQRETEEYVYCGMNYFLRTFLFRIWDSEERRTAFDLFRDHVLRFDWRGRETEFAHLMGTSPADFQNTDAEMYMTRIIDFDHREMVLQEYRAGQIGFRYIMRYACAWARYKAEHFRGKKQ